jgi:glycerol-3-phosphate acyltransferase PlsY
MLEALILNKFILLSFSFSYLLGSIPFGYILFKYLKNKDIRSYGSGNIGATNVNRLLGKKVGAITLFLDFIKVLIPTYVAHLYYGTDYGAFCGICSILGHIFPIWLKFKGGKGVAGFIGFLLITSWPLCLLFLVVWLFSVKILKYSALGAILSILLNIFLFKAILILQFNYNIFYFIPGEPIELNLTIFISLIILLKHKENIKNLIGKKL